MNTPTKEQRDKIDRAIDTVTSICSSGSISPSKAIAKVASDMKLTADYLPIIVRAYNTGAATIHREDSHTMQEKAASYPIAYLDEVMSLLQKDFSFNKKAEVERPRDTFWEYNANYHFPNAWDHIVEVPEASMWDVKQASVKRCTVAKERTEKDLVSTAKRTADEATRIKYAAAEELDKAISEVERILCINSGVKLATAREYATASYGKEGRALVDKLINLNNLEKTAQYRQETLIPNEHPFAKAFEEFVLRNETLKKASADEQKVLNYCIDAINGQVRPKDRYMDNDEAIDAMFKQGEMKRRKKDMYKPYQKKTAEFLKEAYRPLSESGVGGISGLEQLNHPGWVGLDRFERELMYGLADPAHEAKLRNIRVQTILTELMNTDSYLKEKDPEEVLDAMNEILEINPDLHKNKPMLRIALRQFMESGGMDIPTLGVLSEFGKEERERKSREKSQRESAAQQFASQQESARQANEKLRSEEERARADRESREQIAAKELDLKEREFAKKYPELEKEHKGLVRRLVSMGMSVGEIAHNIRHPRQAISEAFTREWERERRDRDLKSHEEDMELNKREAEQLRAANDVMDSTLRGDILQADMGRRDEILNRKQVKDWIDGVNLDRDQRKAVIDQLYANEDARAYEHQKAIDNETTEQKHRNLADTLQSLDNEAKAKALTSKEDLGKAQNRDAKLTEILTSDADELEDQLAEAAQQHRHAPENLLMEDREHQQKVLDSNRDWNNRVIENNLRDQEAIEDQKNRQQAINQGDDRRKTEGLEAATKLFDAITKNDAAKRYDAKRDEWNKVLDKEQDEDLKDRRQDLGFRTDHRVEKGRDEQNKRFESDQREANKADLQQAYKNRLDSDKNTAATNRFNSYEQYLAAEARNNAINRNSADYSDALNQKAQNDIRMFNDQNSQTNLDNKYNQQQWANQQNRANTERKHMLSRITDQAAFANEVEKATQAIDQFINRFGMAPPSSINPTVPDPATNDPGIVHWP